MYRNKLEFIVKKVTKIELFCGVFEYFRRKSFNQKYLDQGFKTEVKVGYLWRKVYLFIGDNIYTKHISFHNKRIFYLF